MRVPAGMYGIACAALMATAGQSQQIAKVGPYNIATIAGGDHLDKNAPALETITVGPWTMRFWVKPDATRGNASIVTVGGGTVSAVTVAVRNGRLALDFNGRTLTGGRLAAGSWTHVAIVENGRSIHLFANGADVARIPAAAAGRHATGLTFASHTGPQGFAGHVAGLTVVAGMIGAAALRAEAAGPAPDSALLSFEQASPTWPVQVRQMAGQVTPQDAWTLSTSATRPDAPVARPVTSTRALTPLDSGRWMLGQWRLAAAPDVLDAPAVLSRPGFDTSRWYAATVPGTVLTTLIERGVYPDPTHGLNNLAIPERLAHQDYWYRSEFDLPSEAVGKRLEIVLNGINYHAQLWVNGAAVGELTGAFLRGRYDVSTLLKAGRNAVAVRISPPPHPGHAQEESLTSGVGENGGMMMLDGPTFGATEGWDWIPTVRDRNTGLWQSVDLLATRAVSIGDPQVVTRLPRSDNSVAEIEIGVPVTNHGDHTTATNARASFDDVTVERQVSLRPGESRTVLFRPATDAGLRVHNPKLWWPNGYGEPALHQLTVSVAVDGETSDAKTVRFGMREITYDLSLIDGSGALRRVRLDLSSAREAGQQVVDVRHEAIRKVSGGWAYSLAPGADKSAAVTPVAGEEDLSPYLVLRVNGVRIAARGGSIGMDDMLKRVDRTRLEPFFRLHRDAHLNVIRNWMGQSTEETFFDLADEYGMLVLNDFWESTQDYNLEAEDVPLFLANARDVIRRFRNHPSIAIWFGRNEGVPQPILNEGLDRLVRDEDGTRLYMASSNRINLHDSGPYNWQPEERYFTDYSKGFAVEVGTPSFPTLEAWKRAVPASELWPISDSWAYHDWHQTGNGAVKTFMDAMTRRFDAPVSLEDFERKAQMLEYASYRAIFEGMNAGLWKTNSGRMLWMTQPAWPSSAWQIFSSDYDTHAAFYGVKKASEPVHVQMNLPDYKVVLVNNTERLLPAMHIVAKVTDLAGQVLVTHTVTLAGKASALSDAFTLDLAPLMVNGPVLVRLEAFDAKEMRVSDNFYWQAAMDQDYRRFSELEPARLAASASTIMRAGERVTTVELINTGSVPAIETKMVLIDALGEQVLPAYFSDNYVSLLPGETRRIEISAPAAAAVAVKLRGFNLPTSVILAPEVR